MKRIFPRLMVIMSLLLVGALVFSGATRAQEASEAGLPKRERVYEPVNLPFMALENLVPPYFSIPFKRIPGFFKGSLDYRNYTHFGDTPQDKRRVRNEYLLKLQYELNYRNRYRLFAIPEFYFDDDHFGRGVINELTDDDSRRNVLNLEELYLDIYFNKFDLRLGKQIFAWGKADELNPTDNLGAKDLQDLFEDRDIGVFAARVNYYMGDYELEGALVPLFTPTRLPRRNSRFSFIPAVTPVPVLDPVLPAKTLENMQWGVRLLRSIRGWDFSASYYDGIYHVPVVRFNPSVGIVPIYEGVRVVGGDIATQFGKLGLRSEVGYMLFDGDMDDDFLQYAVGFDYTFSDVIGDDDIYVLIQYVGEGITDEGDLMIQGLPTSVGRALSSSFTMDLSYEFTEFLKVALDVVYLTDSSDSYLLAPKLEYEYSDRLAFLVKLNLPQGDMDTFFGRFQDSRRLFFSMKYSF